MSDEPDQNAKRRAEIVAANEARHGKVPQPGPSKRRHPTAFNLEARLAAARSPAQPDRPARESAPPTANERDQGSTQHLVADHLRRDLAKANAEIKKLRHELSVVVTNRDALVDSRDALERELRTQRFAHLTEVQTWRDKVENLEARLKEALVGIQSAKPDLPASFDQMTPELKIFYLGNSLASAQRDLAAMRGQLQPLQDKEAALNGQINELLRKLEQRK